MKKRFLLLAILIYLGVYGGKVALWNSCASAPIKIFPYSIKLYPQADQQALTQGIPITSQSDACRLFEDYFS